ncbi:MAG: response regulator [Myxococcales bacterium]|nr:response regulator [Myxococcales bacterium]
MSALLRALELMSDGVLVVEAAEPHVWMNLAARRIFGVEPQTAVTTTVLKERFSFYPQELVASAGEIREEVAINGVRFESVVTPFQGAVVSRTSEAAARAATDADVVRAPSTDGTIDGAIIVLRAIDTSVRAIERKRAEVASELAHDLRSPLTSIAGAIELVTSGYAGELSPKQLQYLDMAKIAANKMTQLLDTLSEQTRTPPAQITLVPIAMDLAHLAKDVVSRFRDVAANKEVRVDVELAAHSLPIHGDPGQLSQVLGNLLSNAIKFAPRGGRISIDVFGPPVVADAVGVSVANAGEPIPAAERERIFETGAAARRVAGTGLGLGISRAIVEAHGGRIWVDSSESGTKFILTLPARPTKAQASLATHVQAGAETARVLIVDDDRHRAYLTKGMLMAAGHKVDVAHDAESALATARHERHALIIVAAMVDSATALISTFDHDPDTRKSAILAIVDGPTGGDMLLAGAKDILQLPLRPTEFRETCERLLRESAQAEAPRILIVDDDDAARAICREVLSSHGYAVRDVAKPELAIAEARRFRPDVILLDVIMPGIDGFGLAERIHADPVLSLTTLVFVSARSETADKVRAFRFGAEDYIVKPFDAAELTARVGKCIERKTREIGASPTTQLPGADAIEAEVDRRLTDTTRQTVCCYLDLDNLKAYNDYYGYAKADGVIRQTADLIRDMVSRHGSPGDFVGHIAGDDFVFLCDAARADELCIAICERFDHVIPLYYNKEDRARGYIETKDRWGVMRKFQTISVSIAAVSLSAVDSFANLATAAATGKSIAKAINGSAYVRDGEPLLAHRRPTAQ